jgi:hypothetical protein
MSRHSETQFFNAQQIPSSLRNLPTMSNAFACFPIFLSVVLALQPLSAADPLVITAGKDWKAIDTGDLMVKPGTALDFSARLGTDPAGSKGRVIARPDGNLAFADEPDKPVRFFGCTLSIHDAPNEPAEIEAQAEAIRRQGYNVVRLHFLDVALARGYELFNAKPDLAALAEFDRRAAAGEPIFDATVLDKLDRFVAALKQRGIYLYLDAMTSWAGYYPANPWSRDNGGVTNMGPNLYNDKGTGRTHWSNCVKALLTHINPYTQTSFRSDPQVLAILGHNEMPLNFHFPNWKERYEPAILPLWRKFLENRYKNPGEWLADWGSLEPPIEVSDISQAPLFTREDVRSGGRRSRIIGEFLAGIEDNLFSWFESELRSFGYEGLYTGCDSLYNMRISMPRAKMGLTSQHGYFAHPSGVKDKSSQINASAVSDGLNWWRSIQACRIAGRPLAVTEYGHVYWNKYRYEEGLSVGAYAAFQDLSMVEVHTDPVELKGRLLNAFRPGSDPVGRASQVVTGILFMTNAVTPAPHRVDVGISREHALNNPEDSMPGDLSRLSLLTGFAVAVEGHPPAAPASLTIPFNKGAGTQSDSIYTASVVDANGGQFPDFVALLKQKGILPEDNQTSASKNCYESETGQILLFANRKELLVRTPTVAGVCVEKIRHPLTVGPFHLESASVPVSATVAALDKEPLPSSGHILLVLATDARNTNDTFADAEEKVRLKIGSFPILGRTGRFTLKIDREKNAPPLQAWALALDGSRRDPLKVQPLEDGILLELDSAEWAVGPTPFIELAAQ